MRYKKGDFFIVPNRSELAGLDPLAQVVFMWLCARADEDGICFPSVNRLATDTGMSRASIFNKVVLLEEKGLIQKTSGDSTKSNTYEILLCSKTNGLGGIPDGLGGIPDGLGVVYEVDPNDNHINNTHEQHGVANATRAISSKETKRTPLPKAECYDIIQRRRDSENDMTSMIAEYLHRRRFTTDTREGLEEAFNRHRRPAKLLLAFSVDKVIDAMDQAQEKIPDEWTLETCYKILTK